MKTIVWDDESPKPISNSGKTIVWDDEQPSKPASSLAGLFRSTVTAPLETYPQDAAGAFHAEDPETGPYQPLPNNARFINGQWVGVTPEQEAELRNVENEQGRAAYIASTDPFLKGSAPGRVAASFGNQLGGFGGALLRPVLPAEWNDEMVRNRGAQTANLDALKSGTLEGYLQQGAASAGQMAEAIPSAVVAPQGAASYLLGAVAPGLVQANESLTEGRDAGMSGLGLAAYAAGMGAAEAIPGALLTRLGFPGAGGAVDDVIKPLLLGSKGKVGAKVASHVLWNFSKGALQEIPSEELTLFMQRTINDAAGIENPDALKAYLDTAIVAGGFGAFARAPKTLAANVDALVERRRAIAEQIAALPDNPSRKQMAEVGADGPSTAAERAELVAATREKIDELPDAGESQVDFSALPGLENEVPQQVQPQAPNAQQPAAEPVATNGFVTAQGSSYELHADGTTTRTKSKHEGHDAKDVGVKERSNATFFVSPDAAREIGMWQTSSATGKRVVIENGQAILVSINPKTGKHGVDGRFDLQTEPQVGLHPLELWDKNEKGWYRKNHPGSAITAINKGNTSATQASPQPETTFPQTEQAPIGDTQQETTGKVAPRPWDAETQAAIDEAAAAVPVQSPETTSQRELTPLEQAEERVRQAEDRMREAQGAMKMEDYSGGPSIIEAQFELDQARKALDDIKNGVPVPRFRNAAAPRQSPETTPKPMTKPVEAGVRSRYRAATRGKHEISEFVSPDERHEEIVGFINELGVPVQMFRSKSGASASSFYDPTTGTVYLNADSSEKSMWYLAGHEFAHASGADARLSNLPAEIIDEARRTYEARGNADYVAGSSEAEMTKEAVAVYMGEFLQSAENRAKIKRTNPSLWQKLGEMLIKLFGNSNSKAMQRVLDEFRGAVKKTQTDKQPGTKHDAYSGFANPLAGTPEGEAFAKVAEEMGPTERDVRTRAERVSEAQSNLKDNPKAIRANIERKFALEENLSDTETYQAQKIMSDLLAKADRTGDPDDRAEANQFVQNYLRIGGSEAGKTMEARKALLMETPEGRRVRIEAELMTAPEEALDTLEAARKELRRLEGKGDVQLSDDPDSASLAGANPSNPIQATEARKAWIEKGTESPWFKRWFGKSKVVDAEGKPLVVYHGTTKSGFNEFQPNFRQGEQLGFGIHFAVDPELANEYAGGQSSRKGKSHGVYPVYLSVQNILNADSIVKEGTKEFDLAKKMAGSRLLTQTDEDGKKVAYMQLAIDATSGKRAEQILRDAGYDGIKYRARTITPGYGGYTKGKESDSYVVFSPTQIKSATANTGTFDAGNADIRLSDDPEVKIRHNVADKQELLLNLKRADAAANARYQDAVDKANRVLQHAQVDYDEKVAKAKSDLAVAKKVFGDKKGELTGKALQAAKDELERVQIKTDKALAKAEWALRDAKDDAKKAKDDARHVFGQHARETAAQRQAAEKILKDSTEDLKIVGKADRTLTAAEKRRKAALESNAKEDARLAAEDAKAQEAFEREQDKREAAAARRLHEQAKKDKKESEKEAAAAKKGEEKKFSPFEKIIGSKTESERDATRLPKDDKELVARRSLVARLEKKAQEATKERLANAKLRDADKTLTDKQREAARQKDADASRAEAAAIKKAKESLQEYLNANKESPELKKARERVRKLEEEFAARDKEFRERMIAKGVIPSTPEGWQAVVNDPEKSRRTQRELMAWKNLQKGWRIGIPGTKIGVEFLGGNKVGLGGLLDAEFEFEQSMLIGTIKSVTQDFTGTPFNYFLNKLGADLPVALLNKVVRTATGGKYGLEGPQLEEFRDIFRLMTKSGDVWRAAYNNAVQSAKEEDSILDRQSKMEGSTTEISHGSYSIPGKVGRAVRAPGYTSRRFGDDLTRTLIAHMEAAARARRIAIKEMATDVEARANELFLDPKSPAWNEAYEMANKMAFQEKGGNVRQKTVNAIIGLRQAGFGLRRLVRFVKTPVNLGVQMTEWTPANFVLAAIKMVQNHDAKIDPWTGVKPEFAKAVLGTAIMALGMASLFEDDEPEGEYGFTGSNHPTHPNCFRSGNSYSDYRKWLPWPAGGALGALVDAALTFKKTGAFADGSFALAAGIYDGLVNSTVGKPLKTAADIGAASVDAKRSGDFTELKNMGKRILAEQMFTAEPRPLTQFYDAAQEETDYERRQRMINEILDVKARKVAEKWTAWGTEKDVSATGSPFGDYVTKLLTNVRIDHTPLHPGDRMIGRWNAMQTDPKKRFRIPEVEMKYRHLGKDVVMEPHEFQDYLRISGQITDRLFKSASFNIEKPTQAQMDALRGIMLEARKTAKELIRSGASKTTVDERIASSVRDTKLGSLYRGLWQNKPRQGETESDADFDARWKDWEDKQNRKIEQMQVIGGDNP